MKKNLFALILALLMLALGVAAAEEELPVREPGNYPERGVILPMTEEDVALGLNCSYYVGATDEISQLPLFNIDYMDEITFAEVFSKYENASEEDMENEDFVLQMFFDLLSCNYSLYQIALFETDYINEKAAGDGMLSPDTALKDLTIIGENDGYTYILFDITTEFSSDDPALKARFDNAAARAMELIDAISFQEIVFDPTEFTSTPDAFPAFTAQDLNGGTVTNDVFAGKDLTVINIWGTFCNPCIEEMPELAAWSAEMPENVQIIGLVSDLNSAEDADTLETAKAICEATGADVYTHLIAGEDFDGLLSGVIGVPTTLFVDRTGALVGDPVVGANVPLCQKIVSDYLGAL